MGFFFSSMGFWLWPLLLLTFVVLYLSAKNIVATAKTKVKDVDLVQSSINGILFWGCISGLTGFLGQITGIYLAVQVIAKAKDLSPEITLMGFAQSFTTTIYGLVLLLFAALIWYALRGRLQGLVRKDES